MFRANLVLAAVLIMLLAFTTSPASEVTKQAKTEPAKEKFFVYGGGCSRSIRLQGTYDSLRAAFSAAEQYRTKEKLRFVTVRTGAHEKDYFGNGASQYKVYRFACRGGLTLHATVEKANKANEIADKLKKEGVRVEIVGHYAAKQVERTNK
jgi:hypothetical protein